MHSLQRAIPWFDAPRCQGAFDAQRADTPGLRAHLICGIVFCLSVSMPFPMPDIGLGILLAAFVLRLRAEGRVLWALTAQLGFLVGAAWAIWVAIGAIGNGEAGFKELSHLRWALAVIALWPIIEHRATLLAWWLLGFAIGHATQMVQLLDQSLALGLNEALGLWDRDPQRISGWWPPVVAGTVLVGVLGARMALARQRPRAAAIAWVVLTIAGLLLTGTRGGWLAMAGLLGLFALVTLLRSRLPIPARLGIVGAAALAATIVGVVLAGTPRAERGVAEVRSALAGDFDSDTGARLFMWRQAARAFAESPVTGTGTGGYEAWAEADAQRLDDPPPDWRIHAHAHGAVPHIAATHGLIGLGLFGLLAWVGLAGGRDAGGSPGAWAIAGVLLASAFESIVASSGVSAHWWLLLGLCPVWQPASAGLGSQPMEPA